MREEGIRAKRTQTGIVLFCTFSPLCSSHTTASSSVFHCSLCIITGYAFHLIPLFSPFEIHSFAAPFDHSPLTCAFLSMHSVAHHHAWFFHAASALAFFPSCYLHCSHVSVTTMMKLSLTINTEVQKKICINVICKWMLYIML